ncbi:DUF2946 domain-containing protein [Noviherbaspirillum sp. ST9]|uniref:DUF2946 domain-containing protein n=1 Tax=Noviherbaspirillum sp. ST9 TaxID=3401606 RepID=UPI003B588055
MNIRIRHLSAWIACCAVLLAALAPTVSRMLAAACNPPSYQLDICATPHTLSAADEDHTAHHSSAPAKKELHLDHCPFCLTHAGSFGLVPTGGLILPDASSVALLPPLFYQSPHPLFVWATPPSRAPPA